MSTDLIKQTAHQVLKAHGFRRKYATWYKFSEQCIVVFNLQHSLYGPFYYINMAAAWRLEDTEPRYPKEYECNFRMRLQEFLIPSEDEPCLDALDFDVAMDEDVRTKLIVRLVERYCIPTLQKLETIDGIMSLYETDPELENLYPMENLKSIKAKYENIKK